MIVVDSSVWIDFFNGHATPQTNVLMSLMGKTPLMVGDLVLCEILRGASSDKQANSIEKNLRKFQIASVLSPEIAVAAAGHYRLLRGAGVTVRKTIDMIIGTFCIIHGHSLLHSDKDFDPMEKFLGLKVVPARWAVHE